MRNAFAKLLNHWLLTGSCCLLIASGAHWLTAGEGKDADSKLDAGKPAAQSAEKSGGTDNAKSQIGQRAWIGIQFRQRDDREGQTDQNSADKENQKGIEVSAVYPNGPAARGGLMPGDAIESINGKPVSSPQEVTETVRDLKPGTTAKIVVRRQGAEQKLTVTLGDAAAFHQQQAQAGQGGNFAQGYYQQNGSPQQTFVPGEYGQQYGANQYAPNVQGGGWAQANGNPYDGVPEHAMMLEYNRRNSEQHQRMESQIEELLQEIKSLRKEIQQLKAK